MRKLWNSNLGRRLSCLALVLVMVLSLLPVRASAVTVDRNVEVLTGEATMFGGGSNGDVGLNFEKLELEWYPVDRHPCDDARWRRPGNGGLYDPAL